MDWLNYHHLLYFWITAKKGSIAEASKILMLSQSTISEQIKSLEKSIDAPLFQKKGRKLTLTDAGRIAFDYAEQIFKIGGELKTILKSKTYSKNQHLFVGVTNSIPKLITYRLMQPILDSENQIRFTIVENSIEELSTLLLLNNVDIVISEESAKSTSNMKLFNHKLGNSKIGLYSHSADQTDYLSNFPQSIAHSVFLLPMQGTSIRNQLDLWFYKKAIQPFIWGEFDDSAIMKVFGGHKKGLFFSPVVINDEVCQKYNVRLVTTLDDIVEEYYAITTEKKIKHSAAESIREHAREKLFKPN